MEICFTDFQWQVMAWARNTDKRKHRKRASWLNLFLKEEKICSPVPHFDPLCSLFRFIHCPDDWNGTLSPSSVPHAHAGIFVLGVSLESTCVSLPRTNSRQTRSQLSVIYKIELCFDTKLYSEWHLFLYLCVCMCVKLHPSQRPYVTSAYA